MERNAFVDLFVLLKIPSMTFKTLLVLSKMGEGNSSDLGNILMTPH